MSIRVGTLEVSDVRVGTTRASKMMVGTTQVWPAGGPQPSGDYFDFLTVTGTSWTQAGDGEVSVRISRAVINPPDQQGNTPPTFVAGDYWRLTNESQGGAVVAEGPLNSVDDTTDPGWIRLQWDTSIPNIAVAGETWRLAPQPAYVTEAINLGAIFVLNGDMDAVSGSPVIGGFDPGIPAIDGMNFWRGSAGAPATATFTPPANQPFTIAAILWDDPTTHSGTGSDPAASIEDPGSQATRTYDLDMQRDTSFRQQSHWRHNSGAGLLKRETVIESANAPGYVLSIMTIDPAASMLYQDQYGSTSLGWVASSKSGAAPALSDGNPVTASILMVIDDPNHAGAVSGLAYFPRLLTPTERQQLLDALPTLEAQP